MTLELTPGGEVALLVGRLLFGGVLAFMGINHFQNADSMTGYAAAKGLPAPRAAVLGSGGALLFGGVTVVTGAFPALGAGALVLFLAVSAVTMHDFWTVEDPERQQQELTQFLKNAAMTGGALVVLALSNSAWPFAVGAGL